MIAASVLLTVNITVVWWRDKCTAGNAVSQVDLEVKWKQGRWTQ